MDYDDYDGGSSGSWRLPKVRSSYWKGPCKIRDNVGFTKYETTTLHHERDASAFFHSYPFSRQSNFCSTSSILARLTGYIDNLGGFFIDVIFSRDLIPSWAKKFARFFSRSKINHPAASSNQPSHLHPPPHQNPASQAWVQRRSAPLTASRRFRLRHRVPLLWSKSSWKVAHEMFTYSRPLNR